MSYRVKSIRIIHNGYSLEITYKAIKGMYMKKSPDGLKVTAPYNTSVQYICEKLDEHEPRLSESLAAMKVERDTVTYFGKDYALQIVDGKYGVERTDDSFIVSVPGADRALAARYFEKYWRLSCERFFKEETARAYKKCADYYGIDSMPKVKITKVRSYFGECFYLRNEIRYSQYLMQGDEDCCRAVIYHELAHFKHTGHGKDFYKALTDCFPDYYVHEKKQKKIKLKMWYDEYL